MIKKRIIKKTSNNPITPTKIFNDYAELYDILYHDKKYDEEAKFISQLIDQFSLKPQKEMKILDLACGTGRHISELVKLGYTVDGSDQSTEMIKVAMAKNRENNLNIKYYNESFQSAGNIKKKYDVILSLFSSLDYLITIQDISKSLKNIHSLLNKGGIFIFDFWNGNAVTRDYSPVKIKRVHKDRIQVIRFSDTTLDRFSQLSEIKFHFIILDNDTIIREFDEKHLVRYFYLQEMKDLLELHNFNIIHCCPFLENSKTISAYDWNVTYIAQKC